MSFDIFPTLLELTGVDPPDDLGSKAVTLLRPETERIRLAEDPVPSKFGIEVVQQAHPEWDPAPWQRKLRALFEDDSKYIWNSYGRHELYDLGDDPAELDDHHGEDAATANRMHETLDAYLRTLQLCEVDEEQDEPLSPQQRELLRGLGYVE